MLRSSKNASKRLPSRRRDWVSPVLFGLLSALAFPTVAARGDLAGLLAGEDGGQQWRMVLTPSPAGSVHQAELAFAGGKAPEAFTGDAGLVMPDGRKLAFDDTQKDEVATPDEERVTRSLKKSRVVAVESMQPPKAFTAGSILQRTSFLLSPKDDGEEQPAFTKKTPKNLQLASFYYRKPEEKAGPGVPTMLADLVTNKHADVLATAYAPAAPDYARVSPFDAILAKPDAGRFVPKIEPGDHAWAATVLSPDVFSKKEQQCLASGVYFEARGESVKGQAAVAQVILNRVRNPAYPGTICDVVYQNQDWRNRCQFSFACDRIADRINSPRHWKIARDVAMAVTAGKIWLDEVGSATHYHAIYVHPAWARTMKKVGRIGLHVFYRTYGGGWS